MLGLQYSSRQPTGLHWLGKCTASWRVGQPSQQVIFARTPRATSKMAGYEHDEDFEFVVSASLDRVVQ